MVDATPVITGATATGKTALSLAIARRIGGEVISLDSRQVYRGMDIGTAKPSAGERAGIRHHGLDLVNPDERYSAGRFARAARQWLTDIRARGAVPLLVGGTGFFLNALIRPFFEEPTLSADRRAALDGWLAGRSDDDLRRWAAALETRESAALPRDRQRLARMIEVAVLTGHPLSWWQMHAAVPEPALRTRVFVLELPRAELYRRINERVVHMIDAGFVDEVRELMARGYGRDDPGMSATGYAELQEHLAGRLSLDEAVARIQAATRRYARRQLTWFRHQLPPGSSALDAQCDIESLAEEVVQALTTQEVAV